MANYWKRRIELFGDAAFAPLTIEGSLNRDEKELSIGFLRLMPSCDKTGRSNIFLDPSVIEGRVYDNESMVRGNFNAYNYKADKKALVSKLGPSTIMTLFFFRNLYQ